MPTLKDRYPNLPDQEEGEPRDVYLKRRQREMDIYDQQYGGRMTREEAEKSVDRQIEVRDQNDMEGKSNHSTMLSDKGILSQVGDVASDIYHGAGKYFGLEETDAEKKARATWEGLALEIPYEMPQFQSIYDHASKVRPDEQSVDAQRSALSGLQDVYSSGGLDAIDQARISASQAQQRNTERGQRMALMQNMQERGMGGSGIESMMAMQAQQGASGRAHEDQLGIQAQAQDRRMQALQGMGQLGGQIRQQGYGEDMGRAQSQNEINKYNQQRKQQNFDNSQTLWGNRMDVAAGATGQYNSAGKNQSDKQKNALAAIAALV